MAGLQTSRIAGLLLLAMLVAVGNRATRYLRAADEQNPSVKPKSAGELSKPKPTKRTASAALKWLARHQMPQGNWSLQKYSDRCTDHSCTGAASHESLAAATALGLLPFLAAGQTQLNEGPFQKTVGDGIHWLISHQKPDGDLSDGAATQMFSHGIAAQVLCECYGISREPAVGAAAQRAIDFIQKAQDKTTGGWRYQPGQDGDNALFAWELLALKSGQRAGLSIKPESFDLAKKWLKSVAKRAPDGAPTGQFSYQPSGAATPTMSAAGLLCSQYLHTDRNDPVMVAGEKYLMANLPDRNARNIYYWLFANQVMHNRQDRDWDTWNHKQRENLLATQVREGCTAGSWSPTSPTPDAWATQGGRLVVTSLSCLILEETWWHRFQVMPYYSTPEVSPESTKNR